MIDDTAPDDREFKARTRAMWASGDFPRIARETIADVGPRLVAAAGVGPGRHVLDVAAGSGATSIPAALTGAEVVASDLTPELLDAGRIAAAEIGAGLSWVEADAEALPFDDGAFDTVLSSFGAMFAPRHQVVADELLRVLEPGGTLAMTTWTPSGWVGQFFMTLVPFMPAPPPGALPPILWGVEDHVRELFGDGVSELRAETQIQPVNHFADPQALVTYYRDNFGPVIAAYANVGDDDARRAELDAALLGFAERSNLGAPGGPARWDFEYLLIVARRA